MHKKVSTLNFLITLKSIWIKVSRVVVELISCEKPFLSLYNLSKGFQIFLSFYSLTSLVLRLFNGGFADRNFFSSLEVELNFYRESLRQIKNF